MQDTEEANAVLLEGSLLEPGDIYRVFDQKDIAPGPYGVLIINGRELEDISESFARRLVMEISRRFPDLSLVSLIKGGGAWKNLVSGFLEDAKIMYTRSY